MTDTSALPNHAERQLSTVASLTNGHYPSVLPNGLPPLDGPVDEEESSTIKCICGYNDDDGSTVLCERCDTWQHILCYYGTNNNVPEVHECAECAPRSFNIREAAERQKTSRAVHHNGIERKPKKPQTKSHKKKPKDTSLTNGWPMHDRSEALVERKSGSPRDTIPPAKRPKTNHRASASTSAIHPSQAPANHRRKTDSTMYNGPGSVKSPTSPLANGHDPELSLEFLNLYRGPEPEIAEANSYKDIGVMNDTVEWATDADALAEATAGMKPDKVFYRAQMEDLEKMAPGISHHTAEDTEVTVNGLHPIYHWVTVNSDVLVEGFVGELTGRIGRKGDYISTPSNRWEQLRHPVPFVFFPPYLPIAIDTRQEGNELRYVRRSCRPNLRMQIFLEGRTYHFCFLAQENISAGEEITIGWEVHEDIKRTLQESIRTGTIAREGMPNVEELSRWITGVLANFGGCACGGGAENVCLMELARRNGDSMVERAPAVKKPRNRKKQQISPISTGRATNSRAGSESLARLDHDDENVDMRSSSSRSKPASRDITPSTHVSGDGIGMGVEMSDRERRKLQQQERLFEQLEQEEQHGIKRRKRNSAGSALNTPGVNASKQLGHSEASPSTGVSPASKPRTPTASNFTGRAHLRTGARGQVPSPAARPIYVDSSTQTSADGEPLVTTIPVLRRRPHASSLRALLARTREDRLQRERSCSVKTENHSPSLAPTVSAEVEMTDQGTSASTAGPIAGSAVVDSPALITDPKDEPNDVEMPDADVADRTDVPATQYSEPQQSVAAKQATASPLKESDQPSQPPPPPWPSSSEVTGHPATVLEKPSSASVDIPPPVPPSVQPLAVSPMLETPGTPEASTPQPLPTGSTAQSPWEAAPAHPILPLGVASAIAPARKKLSLSDYTKSKLKKTVESQVGSQSHNNAASGSPLMSAVTPAMGQTDSAMLQPNAASPAEPQPISRLQLASQLPPPSQDGAEPVKNEPKDEIKPQSLPGLPNST